MKHGPLHFDLFYGTRRPATQGREAARREPLHRHAPARATASTRRSCALDLCLFINGLPVATFELKNSLTKQTVEDAVEQYKRDRDPRERLFEFGRCVVHFAVDDSEVRMCTALQGQGLVVPALQQGLERRRGQPAQPARSQDRLPVEAILTPAGLTNILENYAQIVEEKDREDRARRSASRSGRATTSSTWCGRLLADVGTHGAGKRYLIQHSAGSGKSNSIAWLAHQLIGLQTRRQGGLRLGHRRHRPAHPRPADPGHHQAVHAGGRDRGPRRAFRRPAPSSSRRARRSSSRRCRSSPSSSTRSAPSSAARPSPSSSTRRTRARAARPRRP